MKLQEQYQLLHKQNPNYGTSSERLYKHIEPLVASLQPSSILDYGCGRSRLLDLLHADKKVRYDFGIEEYSTLPEEVFDVVICTDVLEHVPEEEIGTVLKNLKELGKNHIITISLDVAYHHLPNGENCHVTVKPKDWWLGELGIYFKTIKEINRKEFPLKFLFITTF